MGKRRRTRRCSRRLWRAVSFDCAQYSVIEIAFSSVEFGLCSHPTDHACCGVGGGWLGSASVGSGRDPRTFRRSAHGPRCAAGWNVRRLVRGTRGHRGAGAAADPNPAFETARFDVRDERRKPARRRIRPSVPLDADARKVHSCPRKAPPQRSAHSIARPATRRSRRRRRIRSRVLLLMPLLRAAHIWGTFGRCAGCLLSTSRLPCL